MYCPRSCSQTDNRTVHLNSPVKPAGNELGTTENEEDAPPKGVTPEDPPNGVMERLLKLTDVPFAVDVGVVAVCSAP